MRMARLLDRRPPAINERGAACNSTYVASPLDRCRVNPSRSVGGEEGEGEEREEGGERRRREGRS